MSPLAYVLGGVVLVSAFGAAMYEVRLADLNVDLETEKTGRANDNRMHEASAREASDRYRQREAAGELLRQESANAYATNMLAARADAVSAGSAADRLRQRAAALAASCSGPAAGAPAIAASAPASDAGLLLADVLGRVAARARDYAAVADERGGAGKLCEAEHASTVTP